MKKSSMKRALIGASSVVAISLGGLLVAAPANAVVSQCLTGKVCTWDGAGYTPDGTVVAGPRSSYPSNRDNNASSIYNHGATTAVLYDGAGYVGSMFTLASGHVLQDLSLTYPYIYNDRISSSLLQ